MSDNQMPDIGKISPAGSRSSGMLDGVTRMSEDLIDTAPHKAHTPIAPAKIKKPAAKKTTKKKPATKKKVVVKKKPIVKPKPIEEEFVEEEVIEEEVVEDNNNLEVYCDAVAKGFTIGGVENITKHTLLNNPAVTNVQDLQSFITASIAYGLRVQLHQMQTAKKTMVNGYINPLIDPSYKKPRPPVNWSCPTCGTVQPAENYYVVGRGEFCQNNQCGTAFHDVTPFKIIEE